MKAVFAVAFKIGEEVGGFVGLGAEVAATPSEEKEQPDFLYHGGVFKKV